MACPNDSLHSVVCEYVVYILIRLSSVKELKLKFLPSEHPGSKLSETFMDGSIEIIAVTFTTFSYEVRGAHLRFKCCK